MRKSNMIVIYKHQLKLLFKNNKFDNNSKQLEIFFLSVNNIQKKKLSILNNRCKNKFFKTTLYNT